MLLVDGRPVVEETRLTTADADLIAHDANVQARRLLG
jgi:hypothetical protein